MPKYTPLAFEINQGSEGVGFEVGSLFEALLLLYDQRDARGLRYALVTVLVCVVLAKLAGEDGLRGIAQWVSERQQDWPNCWAWPNPKRRTTRPMAAF